MTMVKADIMADLEAVQGASDQEEARGLLADAIMNAVKSATVTVTPPVLDSLAGPVTGAGPGGAITGTVE